MSLVIKSRNAFKIKMDIETLQRYILAAQNAKENMLEGQTFTIEVSPIVDFEFQNLKTFSITTAVSRETDLKEQPLNIR